MHKKHRICLTRSQTDADHPTRYGVFHRIRQDVADDLLDSHRIAVYPVPPAVDLDLQPSLLCAVAKSSHAAAYRIAQIEGGTS
ncbi:MAG: hypothetical protein ACREVO_00180 [Steroidobacteraceae bacterium]